MRWRVLRPMEWGLAALSLWPIAAVAVVFARRFNYPIDLEWCEGGSLYMAYRVLHHLPVYVRPGDVFAPFPYPPAHTLALALAGLLAGGLDYGPARMVSILCFAVTCIAVGIVVRRRFADRASGGVAAVAAAALIACSFPAMGGWYDLVRVDSMMLCFSVLAAALIAEPDPRAWRIVATAVAITIAVYTKQTAAFFAMWICLFAMLRNWRQGLALTATALAFCAIALAVLYETTHGQFWFWIFDNLTSHPIQDHELTSGFRPVLQFARFAPVLPLMLAGLALARRVSMASILWAGMVAMALPASLLPYAKNGGWLNDLIPIVVLLVPLTFMLGADLLHAIGRWEPAVRAALIVAAGIFIVLHPIHVSAFVPDARLRAAADKLNARVAAMQGGVLMPQLAFTPARNGQTNPHWHRMGHADLKWSNRAVDEDWAVIRTQAHWALLNSFDRGDFGMAVRHRYRMVGNLPADERVRMMTGGGVVDINEVWEALPSPGSPPAN